MGMMKCKVEKFEVEKIGFGKELDWLTKHLKKVVELEASRGFIRKIRSKTKTHLMEICFNNRGRFNHRDCYKKEPLLLVIPEGVKGNGWEDLRKAILSVQDYSDQVGGDSKEMFGDTQMSKGIYRGGRSYAEVVAEDGFRTGVPLLAGKWVRAVICECKEKVQDWTHEGKAIARMMGVKGMVFINPISAFKGCFFLKFILKKWRGNEGGKGSCEAVGLDEGEAVVEMLPNVVLPVLLKEASSSGTLSVLKYKSGGQKENGWGGSSLGPVEENVLGPIEPETYFKTQPVRAQKGRRSRGLHAGPDAPQVHETVAASSPSLQRVGSSAKAITQPCPGDERAGVEVTYGEDGRADELKAQTLSNPSPPSEIKDDSFGRRTVGYKLKGPSRLGQI
ncbi:hypothetical protein CK203_035787 [Vitis vinifera]|uniref:DUF4283 domain-containing protein n=1 Tax=Vitis vinifera TaxID=29760 RepID=A0A438FYV7_VITVI|nr:hypothetical protein CK203_035787 [Vitis vinifera]